jgi:hypothetical protein
MTKKSENTNGVSTVVIAEIKEETAIKFKCIQKFYASEEFDQND